jgi:hypothetical protein
MTTTAYLSPTDLDALEPADLVYTLLRSLQHRHTSPLGAQATMLCGVLRGLIDEVPDFQPKAQV